MEKRRLHIDKVLAILLTILVIGGALIFSSAAFGFLARGSSNISSVVFSHLIFGLGGGLVALIIALSFDFRLWRRFAPYLYGFAIFLTALVFVPHIGASHGGGTRWISLFGFSLQPSEGLKIGTIIMSAAYFAANRNKINTIKYGVGGFLAIMAPPAVLLLLQPDLGTLIVVGIGAFSVYIAAGARLRDMALVIIIVFFALFVLTLTKPYVRDRVVTFFHPSHSQQSQGYQIKQSLIAIGSGKLLGRGFGQGVQKFTYLPEAMGDSIFAVAAEELGFVGAVLLISLFLAFAIRGMIVAARSPDYFGALLAVGISSYLASEAFINIASMLGVAPLTGIPLTFISQGGTAALVSLGSAGILLNVSKIKAKSA